MLCYYDGVMEKEIKNLDELREYGQIFVDGLIKQNSHATIIGLSGELGSGKTAFVKSISSIMEINEEVSSPTFVIAKFYPLNNRKWSQLVHVDAYRIEHIEELRALRFRELIQDPKNLIMIEWPELIEKALPQDTMILKFKFINDTTRSITL